MVFSNVQDICPNLFMTRLYNKQVKSKNICRPGVFLCVRHSGLQFSEAWITGFVLSLSWASFSCRPGNRVDFGKVLKTKP